MPTYEYACDACGHQFETFQSMKDDPLTVCPQCEKPALRRLIFGGTGVIFKGSGFYINDSRKNGQSARTGGSSSTGESAATDSSKTEASATETSTTDSSGAPKESQTARKNGSNGASKKSPSGSKSPVTESGTGKPVGASKRS